MRLFKRLHATNRDPQIVLNASYDVIDVNSSTALSLQVTRHKVAGLPLLERGLVVSTDRETAGRAPSVETAAGGRAGRIRYVALKQDALASDLGVRDRDSRQERRSIRVKGVPIEILGGSDLYNFSEVHHRYSRRDVLDDG